MYKLCFIALAVCFLCTMLQLPSGGSTAGVELFAFPVDEPINSYLENSRNRTPVYIPGKCSTNEILYPGDHDNDWVCDCRPGYVYYPQNDACYALFTQGFCKPSQYVDLERPSMLVKCTNNTCTPGMNMVPFRGQCVELNRHNRICPIVKRNRFVVGVNTTSLELDCVAGEKVPVETRFENDEDDPMAAAAATRNGTIILFAGANRCSCGTKAVYSGLCACSD